MDKKHLLVKKLTFKIEIIPIIVYIPQLLCSFALKERGHDVTIILARGDRRAAAVAHADASRGFLLFTLAAAMQCV